MAKQQSFNVIPKNSFVFRFTYLCIQFVHQRWIPFGIPKWNVYKVPFSRQSPICNLKGIMTNRFFMTSIVFGTLCKRNLSGKTSLFNLVTAATSEIYSSPLTRCVTVSTQRRSLFTAWPCRIHTQFTSSLTPLIAIIYTNM